MKGNSKAKAEVDKFEANIKVPKFNFKFEPFVPVVNSEEKPINLF